MSRVSSRIFILEGKLVEEEGCVAGLLTIVVNVNSD